MLFLSVVFWKNYDSGRAVCSAIYGIIIFIENKGIKFARGISAGFLPPF